MENQIMYDKISKIKDDFSKNVTDRFFTNDDIKIDSTSTYFTLSFTDPTILFYKITVGSTYIKKEIIELFNLKQFVFSPENYDKKEQIELIRIINTNEFYTMFYSMANKIFIYYLNLKEVSSFGCCSSFEKCSDEKQCVNTMRDLYLGCQYRKNLEQGRIFYGKNKTI